MKYAYQILLLACLMTIAAILIKAVDNGRYQFIPRDDWGATTGTVVMDTRDATIYHIQTGHLAAFNPITAKRKNWNIDSEGKFELEQDGV